MQLKDKVAAVIGSPMGIERTLCQHFAKEGALSLLPTWKLIKLDGSQTLLKSDNARVLALNRMSIRCLVNLSGDRRGPLLQFRRTTPFKIILRPGRFRQAVNGKAVGKRAEQAGLSSWQAGKLASWRTTLGLRRREK